MVKFARIVAAALPALAAAQTCSVQDSDKTDCYPWDVSNETVCAAHGCCWDPTGPAGTPWCFYPSIPAPDTSLCAVVSEPSRVDCHPEPDASQPSCEARGCCWVPLEGDAGGLKEGGVAACFFPHTDGYTASAPTPTANGFTATLSLGSQPGPYRNDISPAQIQVQSLSESMLRFTISDPASERFTPPVPLQPLPAGPPAGTPDYDVAVTQAPAPFGITVTRRSSGQVMFDSRVPGGGGGAPAPGPSGFVTNGLIFEPQYLELSTALPAPASGQGGINIYGLGEHIAPLQLPANGSAGQLYTLFARDQGTPVHSPSGATNLYGSHPFYMVLDPSSGEAFGVFLFSSAGMDVLLQQGPNAPNALTYRVIGGLLDVFIFTGPTPAQVIQQYHAVIGFPALPPMWALGFHLCRWGYDSLNGTKAVWQAMLDKDMPQEAQWNDIDYMDKYLDFTTDPVNFPTADMAAWVNQMHTTYGQKYAMIFDPGISSTQAPGTYGPWDQGLAQNVFITNTSGQVLIGQVWPGLVGFPDFTANNTSAWWADQIAAFHGQLPFDGMWIDMNEPSNFCDGACTSPVPPPLALATKPGHVVETAADGAAPARAAAGGRRSLRSRGPAGVAAVRPTHHRPQHRIRPAASPAPAGSTSGSMAPAAVPAAASQLSGVNPGDPKYPPYLPGRLGGATLLETKTVSMSASQAAGMHYNVHNLYGWSEGVATVAALESVRGKRAFVISRSTFPSTGRYHGHWLGDNTATWDDLYYSIPGILSMNMFGIPLVGSDTCGFNGDTTPELCTRWMQLSAWTAGFYRNHASWNKAAQDPASFAEPYLSIMRDALNARLAIAPYLYTLFAAAHAGGGTVTRPLMLEFPTDANVAALDRQAMLGPALLVSPVLTQGATSVSAYFPPAAAWYDFYSGAPLAAQVAAAAAVAGEAHAVAAEAEAVSDAVPAWVRGERSGRNFRFRAFASAATAAGGVSALSTPGQATVSGAAVSGWVTLPAGLDTIPVHIRAGYIVPSQAPNMTTVFTAAMPYGIAVALDPTSGGAAGSLYLDDGDSLGNFEAGEYTLVSWTATSSAGGSEGSIVGSASPAAFAPPAGAGLASVAIFGVTTFGAAGKVTVNGAAPGGFHYDASLQVLTVALGPVGGPGVSLLQALEIQWAG